MAFDSNNFYVARKNKLPRSEFNVECNIQTDQELSKIFTISAESFVETKEVLSGCINYTGQIETCVVYMTENGEIGSVHATCPFASKFEDSDITADHKAVLFTKILSYDILNITQNSVSINFTLAQTGFIACNDEVRSVSVIDENTPVKEEEMKVVRFIGETEATFVSQSNLGARECVKKLLLCESQASIKAVEPGLNFVTVTGEVVSRVLYVTENDRFESEYIFDTFKEEVEFEGVTTNSKIEANAFVKYCDIKAIVDNNEAGARIELSVPVVVCLMGYEENEVKVVSDVYSTKNETLIETDSFNMTDIIPFEVIEGKVDGIVVIDDDKPRIDKVLFTGGNNLNLTNVFVEDGILKIEGIAKTNVVYLNDEAGSLQSVEIEIPFVLNERTEIKDDAQLSAVGVVTDADVVVKKGRELFYDAKVKVIVYADNSSVLAVISNVTLADELLPKDYAMQIIFGKKGETSWDIAKKNKVKENLLTDQNPEITFPLLDNTELVIFYQNTKNSKIS